MLSGYDGIAEILKEDTSADALEVLLWEEEVKLKRKKEHTVKIP